MEARNCNQFSLIQPDQRCIDHVFRRHDDGCGELLPRKAGDFPEVVAVTPGSSAWMRMPLSASSCCRERLNATTYALVAPYTPLSVSGEIPTTDAILMIVPADRATNAGGAAYVRRVSAVIRRAVLSVLSTSVFSSGVIEPMPALLTSMVMRGVTERPVSFVRRAESVLRCVSLRPTRMRL
jgi:hypothetical protein